MPARRLPVAAAPAAAGALALTLALLLINGRFTGDWGKGVLLVIDVAGAAALLGVVLLAELPRTERDGLLLAVPAIGGAILVLYVLSFLARILGADGNGAGTVFWVFGVFAAVCVAVWRATSVRVLVLVAALDAEVSVLGLVFWLGSPGLETLRTILLLLAVGLGAAGWFLRRGFPRESVLLIDAGAVAALALGATLLVSLFSSALSFRSTFSPTGAFPTTTSSTISGGGAPAGWSLVVLFLGVALVAFAALRREPGPAFLGALVLLSFALATGTRLSHSLLWWPLLLLLLGIAGLALGVSGRRLPPVRRRAAPDAAPAAPPPSA